MNGDTTFSFMIKDGKRTFKISVDLYGTFGGFFHFFSDKSLRQKRKNTTLNILPKLQSMSENTTPAHVFIYND